MKDLEIRNLENESSEIRQAARWRPGRGLLMVVCLSLLALWALPTMNRWIGDKLIQQLAERVERAPDDRADVPVRQLARFGLQAIDALVAIAASPRAAPATVAREMIDWQVATWVIRDREFQSRKAADKRSPFMSLRLSRLAGALARHVDSLDTAGRRWAQRLTMQIVLHANRITPVQSVQALADCQAVLAVGTAGELKRSRSKSSGLSRPGFIEQDRNALGRRLTGASSQGLRVENLEVLKLRNREVPMQAVTEEPHLSPLARPAIEWDLFATEPLPAGNLERDLAGRDLAGPSELTGNPLREPAQAGSFTLVPSMASAASASDPATALPLVTGHSPAPVERVLDVPSPAEMDAFRQQLNAMPLRELMVRLGSARDFEAALTRAVARARGFSDAELALAPRLASSRVEERFALLRKLSLLPASRARRWLRWLLEDIDGEVRLRALVMIATTGDAQLDALARQRVLKDTDPRVVEQATRIIESRR